MDEDDTQDLRPSDNERCNPLTLSPDGRPERKQPRAKLPATQTTNLRVNEGPKNPRHESMKSAWSSISAMAGVSRVEIHNGIAFEGPFGEQCQDGYGE
jgi:hypothetical protein